ncbi:MAG TPA: flagellar hook-basal body complex protein [Verrucomicrobiae bacterium]|jgi:flagellar hook protein FlgE
MINSLSSAVSGLDAFQQQMDIIGNNIANINTTGYKSATGNLADSFSDTLQAATISTAGTTGDAMQVGTGVQTTSISNNWSTGTINPTNNSNDLAISGNGFFQVQDPSSGTAYVTQDGTFQLNSQGDLMTTTNMSVMGSSGAIKFPMTNAAGAGLTNWTVNSTGAITLTYSDGTTAAGGQIQLLNFTNPQALVSAGDNLYTNMANAGSSAAENPGSGGTGTVVQGSLELSNVDLSAQMASLIVAQRGFEANSKIVTTSDEVLQDSVQMKR